MPAALVHIARPRQWTKNLVSFAALVFARRLTDPESLRDAGVMFVCLSLVSSGLYAFNDVVDRHEDRVHPSKRFRPVAAGTLSVGAAVAEAAVLVAAGISLSFVLAPSARWLLLAFVVLQLLYSTWIKHVVITDVMAIAIGFALRVQAGIEAIGAPQSAWIIVSVFFVALFLGFGKRRGEATQLAMLAERHRRTLGLYSVQLLDALLIFAATTSVVFYAIYAVTIQPNEAFVLTLLPVVFGIARYLMIVMLERGGQNPSEILTRDGPLVAAVVIWTALSIGVVYFDLRLPSETYLR